MLVVAVTKIADSLILQKQALDRRTAKEFYQSLGGVLHARPAFAWLVHFREAVVNGLDLLSFLFVTPELIQKYAKVSAFSRIVSVGAFVASLVAVAAGLWFFVSVILFEMGMDMLFYKSLAGFSGSVVAHSYKAATWITGVVVAIVLFARLRFDSSLSDEAAKSWLFWFGVLMFLISRVFAFTSSVVHFEGISHPEAMYLLF